MSQATDIGKQDFAAGKTAEQNPYAPASQENAEWLAGWTEASQAAAGGTAPASAGGATASIGGTVEAAAAVEGGTTTPTPGATPPASDDESASESDDEPVVEPTALGEEGYRRLMELLEEPPVPEGTLPGDLPSGNVPGDLKGWLEAMKEPLVYMTVDTLGSAVRTRLSGNERGRLRELYKGMTPLQIAAVMQNNADAIRKFADQRAGEAALIVAMQNKLTMGATQWLLGALTTI